MSAPVPPPRTYRDVLRPLFGDAALAEAEKRTYTPSGLLGNFYACADGHCALGVVAKVHHVDEINPFFPIVAALLDRLNGRIGWHKDHQDVYLAAMRIAEANDAGDLVKSGALTALLDSPYEVQQ